MAPNVLVTGASGYLGGSFLEELNKEPSIPAPGHLFALVRNEQQAKQVKDLYNATPMFLDLSDQAQITAALLHQRISIVFYLIDAFKADTQLLFIDALEAVGKKHGIQTHFLHTSGAKLFSDFVGHPTDRPLSDADPKLFDIQKDGQTKFPPMKTAMNANCAVIEAAEARGVKSYIFVPCIVYGEGTGFGNKISIQTQAIVRAAKALRQVCKVDDVDGVWPVSHVHDTAKLYVELLRNTIDNKAIPSGRQGHYLAASGTVAWSEIYEAMAKALHKRAAVDTPQVGVFREQALEQMAPVFDCPKEFVPVQMGGCCTLHADRGRMIGWSPKYPPSHVVEAADAEVELILQHI